MTDEDEFTAYRASARTAMITAGRSAPGSKTRSTGIDTSVPDGVDAAALAAYCLDARRRRADLLAPPAAVDDPAPELEDEIGAGQHRPGPARAGTHAAGAGLPGRSRRAGPTARTGRGRARVLPGRPPSSATCGWSSGRTATSPSSPAGCWSSPRGGSRCSASWPGRAIRCSRPSPPRASRNSPTTATTPPSGWSALGDGTPQSHEKMQAALGRSGRYVDELFRATRSAAALPDVGGGPGEAACRGRRRAGHVLAAATLDRPAAAPTGLAAGHRPRRSAHRGVRLRCSPSCRAWPAPSRTATW